MPFHIKYKNKIQGHYCSPDTCTIHTQSKHKNTKYGETKVDWNKLIYKIPGILGIHKTRNTKVGAGDTSACLHLC